MIEHTWSCSDDAVRQVVGLCETARRPGVLVLRFTRAEAGPALSWSALEGWVQSRSVTVADIACSLPSPALEVALCCDLAYLRPGALLELATAQHEAAAGVVWALGRAGRAALRRGLLMGGPIEAKEAVSLGLAAGEIAAESEIPLPERHSLEALTTARDLLRADHGEGGGGALELAAFRLLFATGEPAEGARAFLEDRPPRFLE